MEKELQCHSAYCSKTLSIFYGLILVYFFLSYVCIIPLSPYTFKIFIKITTYLVVLVLLLVGVTSSKRPKAPS